MTELAVKTACGGHAHVYVGGIGVGRHDPGYTVDAVRELRGIYGPNTSMA